MARIYRLTDRIKIKIDDLIVTVRPLSKDEKAEILQSVIHGRSKGDFKEATQGMVLALKYAIKNVEGIIDSDDKPYQLQFDENKNLTDDCISDLLNLEFHSKLTLVCISLARKIPEEFTDENGKKLEGVEIIKTGTPADPNC